MYDAATKWTPFPDWREASVDRDGWSARPVPGLHQLIVSGDLAAAGAALAPGAPSAGLWDVAKGDPYLVRLARDRALIVGASPFDARLGWNPRGWATSLASDAFFVIEIDGPAIPDVVAEATAADLGTGSPSASILFAGAVAILYRTAERTARVHVETGYGPYLWRWLERR